MRLDVMQDTNRKRRVEFTILEGEGRAIEHVVPGLRDSRSGGSDDAFGHICAVEFADMRDEVPIRNSRAAAHVEDLCSASASDSTVQYVDEIIGFELSEEVDVGA
jgi:hypothetical protein